MQPASTSLSDSSRICRIALVGDYDASSPRHGATYAALHHAARSLELALELDWCASAECDEDAAQRLAAADGVFVTTGQYQSQRGVLAAIRFAREQRRPLIGTCGGFQHVVLEFARNVLGRVAAAHAEYEPEGDELVISPLSCSLRGQAMQVEFVPGTRAAREYGSSRGEEQYYCSFGLNPAYVAPLERAGLVISARDSQGEPRVIELPQHPFFLGTLFVPQMNSTPARAHPLLVGFLRAVLAHRVAAR